MFISYAISSKIEIYLPKYYSITHEQFIKLVITTASEVLP